MASSNTQEFVSEPHFFETVIAFVVSGLSLSVTVPLCSCHRLPETGFRVECQQALCSLEHSRPHRGTLQALAGRPGRAWGPHGLCPSPVELQLQFSLGFERTDSLTLTSAVLFSHVFLPWDMSQHHTLHTASRCMGAFPTSSETVPV